MIRKLRIKFVVIIMSIVTIMLGVIMGLVFSFTRLSLEQESIRMMQEIASRPFQLNAPNEPGEEVRLPYFTIQLGLRGEWEAVGGYYDLSNDEFLDDLIRQAVSSLQTSGVIEEYHLRYYRLDAPLHPCVVFADISAEQATLNHLMKNCLLIGCFSYLVFLVLSILLSKWAVQPVERAWKQQRQFVADASHELKTPLTVIMTNAELAQSPEYEEGQKQKFLASILTMSRQMRLLLEQLLELARADAAEKQAAGDPLDFSRLVSDALLPFEPIFFEEGKTLRADIDASLQVCGSEEQLRQVIEILLDNALKYSREGGATWVTLKKRGEGRCLLTVADEGAEMTPEELKNIFRRFYRADPARSRTGSFGLGLSIAESIVRQHKGKIWAESADGVNRFLVELPRRLPDAFHSPTSC